MPIIPMILVNGGNGIGTGWSTDVPNFNPAELIANIKGFLNGEDFKYMQPWYRGFTGDIIGNETGKKFKTSGRYREVEPDVIVIEELPIGRWTNDYKTDFLDVNLSLKGGHVEE